MSLLPPYKVVENGQAADSGAARERIDMGFIPPPVDALPRSTLIIGDRREEAGSGMMIAHIYPATGSVTRELTLAGGLCTPWPTCWPAAVSWIVT